MNSLNFLESNVLFGRNTILELFNIVKEGNYKKILLITGKNSFSISGAKEILKKLFLDYDIVHYDYSGKALPIEDVRKIYEKIKKENYFDLIIGIGGGTILDITKIISLSYSNGIEDIDDILMSKNLKNYVDLILIPTTAGSGSEATTFAVVYKEKQKYSINSSDLKLKSVILDPNLLINLPKEILKITILDALSHAIESIWARGATELSQTYAKIALEILYKNLFVEKSLNNLEEFLFSSHLAGKAINISKTTAAHAISYPLTSEFGIPHGLAVYLILPHLSKFNYYGMNISIIEKSYTETLFRIFKVNDILMFFQKLMTLFEQFGFNNKLSCYGIGNEDIESIAKKARSNGRLNNNPVSLTLENLEKIIIASLVRIQN